MMMKPIPHEPDNVACKICLEEIPKSVANNQEADEYAQHFCGIECYTIWKEQDELVTEEEPS